MVRCHLSPHVAYHKWVHSNGGFPHKIKVDIVIHGFRTHSFNYQQVWVPNLWTQSDLDPPNVTRTQLEGVLRGQGRRLWPPQPSECFLGIENGHFQFGAEKKSKGLLFNWHGKVTSKEIFPKMRRGFKTYYSSPLWFVICSFIICISLAKLFDSPKRADYFEAS